VSRRTVYQNSWIVVRDDQVIRPDGSDGQYCVIEMNPSVGVVVLSDDQKVFLVGQWRYCFDRFSWEIPTGKCDAGEEPVEAARRELLEEAGVTGGSWIDLGWIDNSNAITTERSRLFLVQQGSQEEPKNIANEPLTGRWVNFSEALDFVRNGTITDAPSVAGLLKTSLFLKRI
jgi:8-oxo-dGTP pyrophosphatase MutT (NUDIX family)